MTSAGDIIPYTACDLEVPGVLPWGPGWFLIAANGRVECGPFSTISDAAKACEWMDDQARGIHPGPWTPRYSKTGLLIGSRARTRRGDRPPVELSE